MVVHVRERATRPTCPLNLPPLAFRDLVQTDAIRLSSRQALHIHREIFQKTIPVRW